MKLGYYLGSLIYHVIPIRREVMVENLKIAFGDSLDKKRRNEIIKKVMQNSVLSFVEFIKLPYISEDFFKSLVIEIENHEYLAEAREAKKSISITGHLGSWEFMGAYFYLMGDSMIGKNIYVLAKFIHNFYFDSFINNRRRRMGYLPIYVHDGMRKIITILNSGNSVCFVADQDARKQGIFVDFFGKPASTFTGPAFFYLKTKAPIFSAFDIRIGITKHKIIVRKFTPPPKDMTNEQKIFFITQQLAKTLEDIVRQYPEQYFWFHKRWKTQPKPEKK